MRSLITILVLAATLAGCASKEVARSSPERPFFAKAVFDDKSPGKRLLLKFEPEPPAYEVHDNKEAKLTEVRFRVRAKEAIDKTFVFEPKGPGIKKAQLVIDAGSERGVLTVWSDPGEGFAIGRETSTDLVLENDDKNRQIASLRAVDAKRRKVSLNVRGAPLDKIIRTLAAESQRSLVLGSSVGGTVSVTLNNLPYEQAIDMILRPTPYRAEHAGDVTVIRSAKDDKTLRTFKLRYVDVNQALETVKTIASKDGQSAADANTNSIFVVDRFEVLKNLEIMLAQLDQEPRQVEVEAAILDIERANSLDIGVAFSGQVRSGVTTGLVTNDISAVGLTPVAPSKGVFVGTTWRSVTGVLSMLATKGDLDLLARPKVLALTDQEASITLGSRLGYRTITVTQNGNIQDVKFLTVGTQLKIKPHITANNDILMSIKPEVSDGAVDPITGIPSANTTMSETKIIAKNGQTIVIGGLLRDRVEKNVSKVPLLGDIPVIGVLFSGISKKTAKTEVMILLSPKIMSQELASQYEEMGNRYIHKFEDDTGVVVNQGRIGQ